MNNLLCQYAGIQRLYHRHIRIGGGLRHGQCLHVGMHGLCHPLAVGNGFHNGARTVSDISRGKYARTGRSAVFIRNQQPMFSVLCIMLLPSSWLTATMTPVQG